jgi:hypothetical protein
MVAVHTQNPGSSIAIPANHPRVLFQTETWHPSNSAGYDVWIDPGTINNVTALTVYIDLRTNSVVGIEADPNPAYGDRSVETYPDGTKLPPGLMAVARETSD